MGVIQYSPGQRGGYNSGHKREYSPGQALGVGSGGNTVQYRGNTSQDRRGNTVPDRHGGWAEGWLNSVPDSLRVGG